MQVKRFIVNSLQVNCYVVFDQDEAIIVDPGADAPEILDYVQIAELQVIAIVNTHGHADHIAGNKWFLEKFEVPLCIHELEKDYLLDPALHLGTMIGQKIVPVQAGRLLKDGDQIAIGSGFLEVLHTPGHSPGSISLYTPGFVLSGDTLFKSSAGRCDLPGGDRSVLEQSLIRLARLPLDTVVYPGHGESSTIREEIQHNPFL